MSMYKIILLAFDGSPEQLQALLRIRELEHWDGARIHLAAVMPLPTLVAGSEFGVQDIVPQRWLDEDVQRTLAKGVKALRDMGLEAESCLLSGDPVTVLSEHAQAIGADLIVVRHIQRRTLLRRWWSDSTARALVEYAPCSVLVTVERED